MKKYIVLLRGINVSGKNKLPMADLRQMLDDLGFYNVKTYIQSGNIILQSVKSKSEIVKMIQEGILTKFKYDVPVIVKTRNELEKAVENYPYPKENEKIVGFCFLEKSISMKEIEVKNKGKDEFLIDGDVIYFFCPNGFGRSKLTNNLFENKLQVKATTRNLRTTLKLLELVTK